MKNDSVREELELKITSGRLVPRVSRPAVAMAPQALPARSVPAPPQPAPAKKTVTANLASPKTSPTLVEFQSKNAMLPDWRIQLQNAVQQRKGGHVEGATAVAALPEAQPGGQGNLALKTETAPKFETEKSPRISDPRVANAMRRISESHNNFFQAPSKLARPMPPVQNVHMRPFGVVAPNNGAASAAFAQAPAQVKTSQKPQLVGLAPPVVKKRDTNKLPLIEKIAEAPVVVEKPVIERVEKIESAGLVRQFFESKRIHITADSIESDIFESSNIEINEIEDLAPFSMRFGAGLFDFIIGGFGAMLVLSPFAFTTANWFTAASLLVFAGTWAMVSFLYMTSCLGFFGKTMGMRLFQLELVDAVENEYPTLRQAAVNSAVFLATMFLAGSGFLTVFFNEEKRALHDLISGTILVREF